MMQIGDEAYYVGNHPGEGWVREDNPTIDVANAGGFWVFENPRQVYKYSRTLSESAQVYKVLVGEIIRDDVQSPLVPGTVKTRQICVLEDLHEKNNS